MNEPITKLDPRYSDPDAVATQWEETRRVLETAELFWLSTVRANGRPHVTPVVAVWLDGTLHFCTGVTEQKARNLRGKPHVNLTTGCNHWEEGLDVVVEGDAVRITDDEILGRLASTWATKWDGRFQFLVRDGCFYNQDEHEAPLGEAVLVFAVVPIKVFAFAQGGTNSHTRHQF
jgi:general stress protein 26